MSESERGIVINVNAYGAMVRLEGGRLASAPAADVEKHRAYYDRGVLTAQGHGIRRAARWPASYRTASAATARRTVGRRKSPTT